MKINIVVDNPQSWIMPFAEQLCGELKRNNEVFFHHDSKEIVAGDVAVFLSCEKIVKPEILQKNKHNLVVHESALPQGKGWSPLTWQILEGKNEIPVTLFEAAEKVDSGDIYYREIVKFEGHELVDELRQKQGEKTVELVKKFIDNYLSIIGKKQTGVESFYERRTSESSELDINKTIAEQFNLLRVVDNERYPAFFSYQGHRYIIKIFKQL